MLRFFVTGTDTGVGKTEVSTALLSLMATEGLKPFAWKPCESGGGNDAERLWSAAGKWQPQSSVCSYRFAAPLAPAMAARLEGRRVDIRKLKRDFRALGPDAGVVEGAGGLYVPLGPQYDVIDLMAWAQLPAIVVSRAGLGTINHTHLSLDALSRRGVSVAAVVLSQSGSTADTSVARNRAELVRRFPRVPFLGPVPFVKGAKARALAFREVLRPLLNPLAGRYRHSSRHAP